MLLILAFPLFSTYSLEYSFNYRIIDVNVDRKEGYEVGGQFPVHNLVIALTVKYVLYVTVVCR
jgi:hypothetical protein